jgi:hypothetical protein
LYGVLIFNKKAGFAKAAILLFYVTLFAIAME